MLTHNFIKHVPCEPTCQCSSWAWEFSRSAQEEGSGASCSEWVWRTKTLSHWGRLMQGRPRTSWPTWPCWGRIHHCASTNPARSRQSGRLHDHWSDRQRNREGTRRRGGRRHLEAGPEESFKIKERINSKFYIHAMDHEKRKARNTSENN